MKPAFVTLLFVTVAWGRHVRYSSSVEFVKLRNVGTDIVNGQEASAGQFPFMVAIMKNDTFTHAYRHSCGAALIRDRWMLSTKNCIPSLVGYDAILGLHDLTGVDAETPGRVGYDFYWFPSPAGPRFDLVLARLDNPIDPGNPYTQPIDYAPENGDDYVGASCWTLGWGERFDGDPEDAGVLRYIETNVISKSECEERTGYDLSTNICAFTGYSGPCGRDIGGPLICTRGENTYLVGVLHNVLDNSCFPTLPAVYTRVSLFTLWIESTIDLDNDL